MPSTLLRIAVALLTFGVGVSTTMFWIAFRTPDVKLAESKRSACSMRRHVAPLPPLPMMEEPPPPPAPLLQRAPVSGGILNGQAISRPPPVSPPPPPPPPPKGEPAPPPGSPPPARARLRRHSQRQSD